MKPKSVCLAILGVGLVLSVPFALAKYNIFFNKSVGTEYQKSVKDMEREAFKSSKPYVENMVQTLASYKMQYDLADAKDKDIIRKNIIIEYSNFDSNYIENQNLRDFLERMREEY